MRDAAFVKACELVVEFRKQASHWKKLLFATSDELSAARHALSDIAKHCGLKSWTIPQLVESVGLALAEDPAALQEALSKMTKERDAQSALVAKQRHLLAAKQTEIGALEAERDEMKEEIKQANKEASDATARQRMTEARALNYSLQADEARREIERLRSEVESLRAKLTIHSDEMTALAAPEASHDTPAGKEAAEAAAKDEIKVGNVVEVVSNTGVNTWLADVDSVGTVTSIETIEDSLSVRLADVPGRQNVLGGYVSLCDVRKVPQ